MFNFSQFADSIGDIFGQAADNGGGLLQQLGDLGLDPSQLEGLDAQGLLSTLTENGVDVSQLDIGEIGQLSELVSNDLPLADLLGQVAGRGG